METLGNVPLKRSKVQGQLYLYVYLSLVQDSPNAILHKAEVREPEDIVASHVRTPLRHWAGSERQIGRKGSMGEGVWLYLICFGVRE